MGGWLMMLAAKVRKDRISGLIGLAAATDFGNSLYSSLSKKSKKELNVKGKTKINSKNFSYTLSKKFFIDLKKNNILNKTFKFNKPFILIHGIKDEVVNYKIPQKIMNNTKGNKVQIHYLNSSNHRLSEENDLKSINNSITLIRSLI